MRNVTLDPDTHTRVVLPREGDINYMVSSSEPISIIFMNIDGYDKFMEGEDFDSIEYKANTRAHSGDLELAPHERWYMLLINVSDRLAKVNYEFEYNEPPEYTALRRHRESGCLVLFIIILAIILLGICV